MNRKADSALNAIPTPADRDTWYKILMAYKAAGGDQDTADQWSQRGDGYDPRSFRDTWRSIKTDGGITEASLYGAARENGWTDPEPDTGGTYQRRTHKATARNRSTVAQPKKPQPPAPTPEKAAQIGDYIAQTAQHRAEALTYWKSRGLSEDTADRFNIGYDPSTKEVIIPYPGAQYYVARYTQTAPNGEGKRYRYPAGISKELFNAPALTGGAENVFITEGQIDAITLEQLDGAAVGSNEAGQITDAISRHGTTAKRFFIIPDADHTGTEKAGKMLEALTAAGLEAYIYPLPDGMHDCNDCLQKDGAGLWDWIREAPVFADRIKAEALAEYNAISGAGRMAGLFAYIKDSEKRPVISTGYPTLDLELGDGGVIPGGLTAGLYTIGAISSLGKTTFVMQMADHIAASGRDVLIIALEMAAFELMAKSISRITTETAGRDSDRKTVQGILQGTRWTHYSPEERQTIDRAAAIYAELAKHIFIAEGIGTIGAAEVRKAVEKHRKIRGAAPVVIVDYLQILAPADPRATDKANTDAAVLEMKRISRDYNTPVICISSFNRSNYRERVSMEALKESGAIEYSSDVVIGLQLEGAGGKDFDVDKAKAANPRKIEAVILKNRNAPTGKTIPFEYEARFNLFRDIRQGHRYPADEAAAMRSGNLADLMK